MNCLACSALAEQPIRPPNWAASPLNSLHASLDYFMELYDVNLCILASDRRSVVISWRRNNINDGISYPFSKRARQVAMFTRPIKKLKVINMWMSVMQYFPTFFWPVTKNRTPTLGNNPLHQSHTGIRVDSLWSMKYVVVKTLIEKAAHYQIKRRAIPNCRVIYSGLETNGVAYKTKK